MGKGHSKKRKDASNCTKDNAGTSRSSRKTTGQSRDQAQGIMADKKVNSLPDIESLSMSESELRPAQTHSKVSGVRTDHDQEANGKVQTERGVVCTGNPGVNFHYTEVPSDDIPQSQVGQNAPLQETVVSESLQTSSCNAPIPNTEVPVAQTAKPDNLATRDTEHQAERSVAFVRPIQEEQTSSAHSNPLTYHECLPLTGQPCSLNPTSTQEQSTRESEAITLTLGRSDTNYLRGTVSEKIIANQNLKQKIALHLDRYHSVVKNWQHLASASDAPIDVITQCRINAEYGHTQRLFEYIHAKQPDLTVKEFVSKLQNIGRNDVVSVVCKTLNHAENSTERFCTILNNNMQLADDIARKLDVESRVNKTWEHMAYELGLGRKKVNLIKSGHSNPTAEIMEYVFTKHPGLTLRKFKEFMVAIGRNDVLELLLSCDETKRLVEVMPRYSELLEDVSICLNKNAGGSLKDWKHFACHLKIPPEIYGSYDPKKPHSPTEILLEWLTAVNPNYTVEQLCSNLQSIERNDVFELIKSTLEASRH